MIGLIFDCDGTLVDTEHLKFLAWNHALKSHGVEIDMVEYMALVGLDAKLILDALSSAKGVELPSSVLEKRKEEYRKLREEAVQAVAPTVDFVKEAFSKKEELGIKLAVASGDTKENILFHLKAVGLEHCFEATVSGIDDVGGYVDAEGTNKPKPYVYQEAAKQLGLQPGQCLAFEDTSSGVESASGAGIAVIAIPNDITKRQDFSQATMVLDSLANMTPEALLAEVDGLLDT